MDHDRRINWPEAALYTAAAAITLVEPRKLRGWRRTAYWGAVSLLTGAGAVAAAGDDEFGTETRAATMAAVSGVTFGLREPFLALDALVVDQLRRLGIGQPRLLLAGLTLAAGAVAVAQGARRGTPDEEPDVPAPQDIEPRVRQVVAEMLARTDEWGAAQLREQFAAARQLGPFEHGYVEFEVPEDAPEVPVESFTFPVHGRGTIGGAGVVVSLHVEAGRLSALFVDPEGDADELRIPDDLEYSVGHPG